MILILCPTTEEFKVLESKVEVIEKKKYNDIESFKFETKKDLCLCILAKIGKANVGYDIGYIASQEKITRIICLGVAGSLHKEIVPLNVIVATKVCYYDVDATSCNYKLGQLPQEDLYYECDKEFYKGLVELNTTIVVKQGLIITGDSFATINNMTQGLLDHFDNPLAVDMESAAVGQLAKRLQVPFNVIRGISDNIIDDLQVQQSTYEEFLNLSSRHAASIMLHLLNEDYTTESI